MFSTYWNPRCSRFALAFMLTLAPIPLLQAADNNAATNSFNVRFLISDQQGVADHQDVNLINAWGIVFNPDGPVWVNDNGTGVATLYDGDGNPQPQASPLVVTIPPPPRATGASAPTGIVFNNSADFEVGTGLPALFIFATEDGTIAAWNPEASLNTAVIKADNSGSQAVYKGLALAGNGTAHFLYATDFRHGKVVVFDKDFKSATLPGAFEDPTIPAGFAPFGISNINGDIYVTYAKQDENKEDDVAGVGNGFVNVFDTNGRLIRRVASRGQLNSPWGLALAPAGFGGSGGRLLVGNFGDGAINVFDVATGEFKGLLHDSQNRAIRIDGLWGLSFGNGVLNQPTNVLFFAAGPNDETHGLYGRITPAVATSQVGK